MIVSDTAIKNRLSVGVLSVIILIFGAISYNALPREREPDITLPYVFVTTEYKGVSSTDIENSITREIEKKLKSLDGVKKIHSISSEGRSQINTEFITGTDIDDALSDVKDKVDEAKGDLPQDLENDPSVYEVNLSERPIVVFSLSGTCGLSRLKEIADDLEEDFEAIPGVLEVDVTGGLEREIRIEVEPDKLSYYNIPITAFQSVVTSENQNTSGGTITLGDGRYQLRVPGEFQTPEEIFNLVISTHNGNPVYLKDVAEVVDGFEDETSRSRLDGQQAVNIAVKKRTGENIIPIAEEIDKVIAAQSMTWPEGTKISKLMDKAKDIHNMVIDLENNILSGLILVVVVLLFALGLRNALLVGAAIPFSMLLSFIVLDTLGITLNMVVLFSLTLALGMLVDNAIVIVENIYRYMEQGVPRTQAAMKATSEVAYPVIASTMTTLAAFAPMIFWPGIMGEFMKYLPITLIVTLSSSLFVAMVINPALTAFFMKVKSPKGQQRKGFTAEEVAAAGEKPVNIKGPVLNFYRAFLEYALNRKGLMLFISFASLIIFIQIWLLTVGIEKPVEFFPAIDPKNMYVNIEPPEGADLDYIDQITKKVELAINNLGGDQQFGSDQYEDAYVIREHAKADGTKFMGPSSVDNIEHIYAKTVEITSGSSFSKNLPNHIGVQFLDFMDRKTQSAFDVERIRTATKDIPGAKITVESEKGGPPTGAPINIEISGDNFATLGQIAKQIKPIIAQVPFTEDIRDDYVEGIPSIRIRVDRQKAAIFGLSTNTIGFALKTAYNGIDVTSYREGDDDFDINVKLKEDDRKVMDVLRKLMIPSPSGQLVPLTTIAFIDYSGTLGDIVRIDHKRVVTVKANVDETKIPGAVAKTQAEKLLKEITLPPGYEMKFTGEHEHQQESQEFLTRAFAIAIFLIFLILVTIFNSISQPIIIMTSVILSLGGAFLGLTFLNFPFGIIMSGVGVISLAGVVVNNAIVLIDYTNKLREGGMELRDAVISAGATRLRPVILTAITTLLGLLPMVTGISFDFHEMAISWASESSQYWRSMAIVVIFGLMIATFLTLVVVPTLYMILAVLPERAAAVWAKLRKIYWKPFESYQ
jgi:multidrug efflux pump